MTNTLKQFINEYLEHEDDTSMLSGLTIYCDMDGVSVDFVKGSIERINRILDGELADEELLTSKSMRKDLRKIQKEKGYEWRVASSSDINYRPVRNLMMSYISFSPGRYYKTLPVFTDGVNELWPFITSLGYDVKILSAPVKARPDLDVQTAAQGKEDWVKSHLSPQPSEVIVVPAREKRQFAVTSGIQNLLIDDKESTILEWKEDGGIGIHHTPGNSKKTIQELILLGLGK